jgi:hypothetical protein
VEISVITDNADSDQPPEAETPRHKSLRVHPVLPRSPAKMRSADPPEEVMREREQRKAATLVELRALDAQPFAPPGGLSGRPWRDVAFPLLMATLRRFHPSKSDDVLIPGAIRGVMECDAAWIAYRAGAAGALFDVMTFCELWELPMHGSAAAEALRLMGDALQGVGRKKRGQQAHPLSKPGFAVSGHTSAERCR